MVNIQYRTRNVECRSEGGISGLGGPPEADKCFGGYVAKKYLFFGFFC